MTVTRTCIRTPRNEAAGLDLMWGEDRDAAIEELRRDARFQLAKAQAVLETPDDEFEVTIRRGYKLIRTLPALPVPRPSEPERQS